MAKKKSAVVAGPSLPSSVGYGMESLLPSGEKRAQQLTGLTGRSCRSPFPLGFAIKTAFDPIVGSTHRS